MALRALRQLMTRATLLPRAGVAELQRAALKDAHYDGEVRAAVADLATRRCARFGMLSLV